MKSDEKKAVSGNRSMAATSELTRQPHLCVLVRLDKPIRQKLSQSLKWVRLKATQMISSELITVDLFKLKARTLSHGAGVLKSSCVRSWQCELIW